MTSMDFHIWNEQQEFRFSFDMFPSYCTSYFIRCVEALPSGILINLLANGFYRDAEFC